VVNRWNGGAVREVWVDVFESSPEGHPIRRLMTSKHGLTDAIWLLEREVDGSSDTYHGPYYFRVDGTAVHGEAESPGNARWEGVIEIVDLEPPVLVVKTPHNASYHNVTSITVSGTVSDAGSGLTGLEASVDGGRWDVLATENGSWEMVLDLLDGRHTIGLRATDADGGETAVTTVLTVDTIAPLIVFTSPAPGTIVLSPEVQIIGCVVDEAGTPISEVQLDGNPLELNDTGFFSKMVFLPREGASSFLVTAVDRAGNWCEEELVIVMDKAPPHLRVDDLPEATNEQMLTVSGSVRDILEVSVLVNGDLVGRTMNGTFEATVVLSIGPNQLTIEAVDAVGNRVSVRRTVIFDTIVNGTIVYPTNDAVLRETFVLMSVGTDPFAWVRVRDRTDWILAPANGTFDIWVPLDEGDNELVVEFRDAANNTHITGVHVVVSPEAGGEGTSDSLILWIGLAAMAVVAVIAVLRLKNR
jgi:hypothetical protein